MDQVKEKLIEWTQRHGPLNLRRAAAEGYGFESELVLRIASDFEDLLGERLEADPVVTSVLLQDDDPQGERRRFTWNDRKAPSAAAFAVHDVVRQLLEQASRWPVMSPPGLVATLLPIQRVREAMPENMKGTELYTAVVVKFEHPLARTAWLIVATEEP